MKIIHSITCAAVISSASAFSPNSVKSPASVGIAKETFDPLNLANPSVVTKVTVATAAAVVLSPLVAFAEDVADDYEYGAVDAPIGLAWGVGLLAVATALLPLAMQGGEEAFEEMRENDKSDWGTGKADKLNKRR